MKLFIKLTHHTTHSSTKLNHYAVSAGKREAILIKEYHIAVRHLSRNARLFYASASLFIFIFLGVYLALFNLYMLRLGFDTPFIGFANALGTLTLGFTSLPAGRNVIPSNRSVKIYTQGGGPLPWIRVYTDVPTYFDGLLVK